MNNLNKNYEIRDKIIFGDEKIHWVGGIAYFYKLSLEKIEILLKNNFIDLNSKHGESSTAEDFLNYMRRHSALACGYVVSHHRSDYRMIITGLIFEGKVSSEMKKDFVYMSQNADELEVQDDKLLSSWH